MTATSTASSRATIGRPADLSVIDAFVQVYPGQRGTDVPMPRENLRDAESLAAWPSTDIVAHLFGTADERKQISRDAGRVVEELDRWGIRCAQVPVALEDADEVLSLLSQFDGRFVATVRADPHDGMVSVRALQRLSEQYDIVRSCSITPAMLYPPIAPDSREYFPLYAKCVELDLPVYINVGIPGPRVPSRTQDPLALDDVCWFFPDLTVVMRHGGEPWADVCVRLMLKWPNLYYATSAYAPKYLPQAILDYANTRGTDKVIYAGYWPTLSFEDIFGQLDELQLRPHVWPKFLYENAARVFHLT